MSTDNLINNFEITNNQLDRRLEELRTLIRNKRNNIQDLEDVLHQDIQKMKKFPIWFWFLLITHFCLMLFGWKNERFFMFLLHFCMYLWFHAKLYREISLRWATVTGLTLIVVAIIY